MSELQNKAPKLSQQFAITIEAIRQYVDRHENEIVGTASPVKGKLTDVGWKDGISGIINFGAEGVVFDGVTLVISRGDGQGENIWNLQREPDGVFTVSKDTFAGNMRLATYDPNEGTARIERGTRRKTLEILGIMESHFSD